MSTNYEPEKIVEDVRRWINIIDAKILQIRSAMLTLKAYIEEQEENK